MGEWSLLIDGLFCSEIEVLVAKRERFTMNRKQFAEAHAILHACIPVHIIGEVFAGAGDRHLEV